MIVKDELISHLMFNFLVFFKNIVVGVFENVKILIGTKMKNYFVMPVSGRFSSFRK